ncbi:MAG: Lrp/AsnC family transcriptional regulator [Chitinophagales bacterium]|nr:Lrp/AsnC family transcriptional regulator [Chitinophagales bacterium]
MTLDRIDVLILREVQQNAKTTIKELSEITGLSSTPIFERLRKMENEKIIQGYRAELNAQKLGFGLTVMCYVSLRSHQSELIYKFQEDVVKIEEVLECYHIAGVYDYLLKVIVYDIESYQKFLSDKLATLGNIGNVQSNFIMNTLKSNGGIPI